VLSLEPVKVLAEVRSQARARDTHLDGIQLLLDKFPGAWWSRGGILNNSTEYDGENASFEYLSYSMSQLVWANPRWRVTTRRGRAQQFVAEAMQFYMNRWSVDSDLKTTLEDLAVDFSFGWAVAHVSPQPTPETYEAEDPVMFPQLSRISPLDYGLDHRTPAARRTRMQWHRYMIDKDDLLERAKEDRRKPKKKREGWDVAAIRGLNETERRNATLRSRAWAEKQLFDEPDREQVEVLEVYFPQMRLDGEPGPEDGFNGVVATYGVGQGSEDDAGATVIRAPRPFFGPRWGPYTMIGAYIVPDSPFPLSLLAACGGHIEQASRLSRAVDRQVEAYKRLGITDDLALAKLIKDGVNDHVYTHQLPNPKDHFAELVIGGTEPANVAAEQRSIAKRDRAMGFAENQRGTTSGDTATDVTYANEAAMSRQGYVKGRYQDGVRRAGRTVAWYAYHTNEIELPLGQEAYDAYGLDGDAEAWFTGGEDDDGSGMTFDDLGLEVEPGSMERPSEQAMARQGEVLVNVLQLLPAIAQAGQIGGDVKGLLDAIGAAGGIPQLSRLFPGIESADLSVIQPQEAEPRLSRDVGLAGVLKSLNRGAAQQGNVAGKARGAPQTQAFAAGA
jgi:hypothetical protein